jgi:hypothetical protein
MVIEALGFGQGRGRSPLTQANREYQNWLDQRIEKELIQEGGLTREAAAKSVNEGQRRSVKDHARRSRRVRRKLGGES